MAKKSIIETDISKLSIAGCKIVLHYIFLALVKQAIDENVVKIQDIDDLTTVFCLDMMVGKL